MTTYYTTMASPVGDLLLAGGDALERLHFSSGAKRKAAEPEWKPDPTPFREAVRQLDAYFAGELHDFDLTLSPQGTAFQLAVWSALREIPYGRTISYGELARRVGNPNASRAVGLANGSNPIAIIVPCHRVIGANGKLTGFGGGLPVKEHLLALERRAVQPELLTSY